MAESRSARAKLLREDGAYGTALETKERRRAPKLKSQQAILPCMTRSDVVAGPPRFPSKEVEEGVS